MYNRFDLYGPVLKTMSILVIGGTGTVGSQLVAELVKRGEYVKILTRDPLKRNDWNPIQVFKGDLETGEGLEAACNQADAVFLLTSMAKTKTLNSMEKR